MTALRDRRRARAPRRAGHGARGAGRWAWLGSRRPRPGGADRRVLRRRRRAAGAALWLVAHWARRHPAALWPGVVGPRGPAGPAQRVVSPVARRALDGGRGGRGVHPGHRGRVPARADRADRRSASAPADTVLVESLLPIVPTSSRKGGRTGLSLPDAVRIERFRVLPGDDASCLNLYAPSRPRILGAAYGFPARRALHLRSRWPPPTPSAPTRGCCSSGASRRRHPGGGRRQLADYVLHTPVGGDFVLETTAGRCACGWWGR